MGKRNRERRREKQRKRPSGWPAGQGPSPGKRSARASRPPKGEPLVVEALILAAGDAFRLGEEATYARLLGRLGLGGGAAAEAPSSAQLSQVLHRMADQALASAWQWGWQPADVERVVRRRLRSGHAAAVVAAIAHQHRSYAAATVAPTWRAQLRALGADPWGPAPPPPERFGALPLEDLGGAPEEVPEHQATIEVLSVLWSLPRLPRLLPLPGQAQASSPSPGSVDARVLERVRALLAKAESTTFAEEAEAFTAKAQELMARHAVDRAMLDGAARGGGALGRRIGVDDPYAQAKSLLLAVVAEANRSHAVWTKNLGFSTVFGHEPDLDAVDLLYTSLLVQATAAMAAAGRAIDRSGRSRTRSFRTSFLVAYANRIGQRLRESTAAAEAAGAEEHGAKLVPVLAARSQAVDDAVKATFPDVEYRSVAVSNGAGWAAGTAAAEMARLSAYDEVRPGQASA
jgi:hypothetical protein